MALRFIQDEIGVTAVFVSPWHELFSKLLTSLMKLDIERLDLDEFLDAKCLLAEDC